MQYILDWEAIRVFFGRCDVVSVHFCYCTDCSHSHKPMPDCNDNNELVVSKVFTSASLKHFQYTYIHTRTLSRALQKLKFIHILCRWKTDSYTSIPCIQYTPLYDSGESKIRNLPGIMITITIITSTLRTAFVSLPPFIFNKKNFAD